MIQCFGPETLSELCTPSRRAGQHRHNQYTTYSRLIVRLRGKGCDQINMYDGQQSLAKPFWHMAVKVLLDFSLLGAPSGVIIRSPQCPATYKTYHRHRW